MPTTIDHGLIVDTATDPPTCAGYIFNFEGHGAYAPDGKVKVGDTELTQAQVDEHSRLLGEMEKQAAIAHGKAVFYFSKATKERTSRVSNWCGSWKSPYVYSYSSFTPGVNCGEHWHVYFTGPDGKTWYGINQGDNQIVRARRLKKQ